MNKLYFLGAILALTFSNAQTKKSFSKKNKNENPKTFVSTLKASEVKFDQTPDFENTLLSMVDQNDNQVFAADDFQLSERTKISQFIFYGTQDYGDLPAYYLGSKMYIFNDNNGVPDGKPSDLSNAVAVIDIPQNTSLSTVNGTDEGFVFKINVSAALGKELILDSNKRYWVAFAPKIELGDDYGADDNETFYWASGTGNYSEPVLIDEDDLFEGGVTNWTPISDLGAEDFNGLAFTITGETALGTTEVYSNLKNVSVYPNPAVNVINLKANKKNNITKTEIFDMNGKLVISSTETSINVEKLPKAVYVVKVYSGNEVIETTKVIKK